MKLNNKQIDACFEGKNNQADVLEAIYKLVFPQWDFIEKIEGWPKCGEAVSNYVFKRFFKFDREHHPDVMVGGLWMNSGFGCNKHLQDWEVDVSGCKITAKETHV